MMKIIGRERKLRALKLADASTLCVGESIEAVDFADDDWEIINPSDDEDTYSFNESSGENEEEEEDLIAALQGEDMECKDVDSFGSPSSIADSAEPVPSVQIELVYPQLGYDYHEEDYGDENDDDEEEEDDDYGLNDELVPKSVSDRFGRQRMRKFGKKAYPKINKSKKSVYYYHRPGCLQGKHGLGLKHSLM